MVGKRHINVASVRMNYFYTLFLFDRTEEKLRLFVAVHSSPRHIDRRKIIRKTWGAQIKKLPGVKVIYIFGKSSDVTSQVIMKFDTPIT